MSELANKLIEENKRTKATTLDLGNCGLSEIPAEVGELVWLESLYFSEALKAEDISPLARLTALQVLDLADGRLSDVTVLASLSVLQFLRLSSTQVSDLTPLASLSALQSLALFNTRVSDSPPRLTFRLARP